MADKGKIAWAAVGVAAGIAAREVYRWWRAEDIAGQVVLITGGSRGLGLALARAFAAEGCRIALCARDGAELERAREDLVSRGAEVFTAPCDVTNRSEVEGLIGKVAAHWGSLDILVNNAGEITVAPVELMSVEDFERAMAVMFWGTVYPTMAALPQFFARGTGRVVNITSIGGKVSMPHLLPYGCAKFAAVGFSEGLRAELGGYGVKVITIAPGLMRTGSYLNARFAGEQDREAAWFGLGAALPGVSMSAERAARQIVAAARRGDAERILTTPANLLARFHGLFPGATAEILGLVNRLLLPKPGASAHTRRGAEIAGLRGPVVGRLTALGRKAARDYLQPVRT